MIANSLAVSAKAETAARYYNMRVVECRLATTLLALKLGLSQVRERRACVHHLQVFRKPAPNDVFAMSICWTCPVRSSCTGASHSKVLSRDTAHQEHLCQASQ